MRERDQLYDFLIGLDDIFSTVKTQILSMAPTFNLGQAYHLVAENEQQHLVSATHKPVAESYAFQTQGTRKEGSKKERPRCDYCQKIGHIQEECWEIVGYPTDWRKPNRDKKEKAGTWNGKRAGSEAAQVIIEESPIPGLPLQLYDKLMQQLKDTSEPAIGMHQLKSKPSVNMAGLTLQDPDKNG